MLCPPPTYRVRLARHERRAAAATHPSGTFMRLATPRSAIAIASSALSRRVASAKGPSTMPPGAGTSRPKRASTATWRWPHPGRRNEARSAASRAWLYSEVDLSARRLPGSGHRPPAYGGEAAYQTVFSTAVAQGAPTVIRVQRQSDMQVAVRSDVYFSCDGHPRVQDIRDSPRRKRERDRQTCARTCARSSRCMAGGGDEDDTGHISHHRRGPVR